MSEENEIDGYHAAIQCPRWPRSHLMLDFPNPACSSHQWCLPDGESIQVPARWTRIFSVGIDLTQRTSSFLPTIEMKQHSVRTRQSTSSAASIPAWKRRFPPGGTTLPVKRRTSRTVSGPSSSARSISRSSATIPHSTQHAQDAEETNESLEHVVMAIDRTGKGLIGCAYYIAREEILCYVEPIDNGGSEAIEIRE